MLKLEHVNKLIDSYAKQIFLIIIIYNIIHIFFFTTITPKILPDIFALKNTINLQINDKNFEFEIQPKNITTLIDATIEDYKSISVVNNIITKTQMRTESDLYYPNKHSYLENL